MNLTKLEFENNDDENRIGTNVSKMARTNII